jgi:ABC-2 type transport system ATP-binding protein
VSLPEVIFDDVSKFYGDILGVNRVTMRIPPGITSLVGPNGSGKTTLMNLMTGLVRPDRGTISVRGIPPSDPERLMRITGYATQYDAAPKGTTGFDFVASLLELQGRSSAEAGRLAWKALERLGMTEAARRKVAGYSKGMRQRVRLAQAIAHDPEVLVLDEPLNGLDPLVRAETIELFRQCAARGCHVIISSHVLQEVDVISDQVILIANGMIAAEGKVRSVREEIQQHPSQFLLRCPDASRIASMLFAQDHITEIRVSEDRQGLLVATRSQEALSQALTRIAREGHRIESVLPADESVDALYRYLIGGDA